MKRITLIVMALMVIPVLAFAMPGNSPKTLVWDHNTEEDKAGYKIYWGPNQEAFNDADSIDVGDVSEYPTADIPGPKVAITCYDTSANESEFSNVVNLDNTAPSPNSTLRTENR